MQQSLFSQIRQQPCRQVIYAIETTVFENIERGAFARSGATTDNDQAHGIKLTGNGNSGRRCEPCCMQQGRGVREGLTADTSRFLLAGTLGLLVAVLDIDHFLIQLLVGFNVAQPVTDIFLVQHAGNLAKQFEMLVGRRFRY